MLLCPALLLQSLCCSPFSHTLILPLGNAFTAGGDVSFALCTLLGGIGLGIGGGGGANFGVPSLLERGCFAVARHFDDAPNIVDSMICAFTGTGLGLVAMSRHKRFKKAKN